MRYLLVLLLVLCTGCLPEDETKPTAEDIAEVAVTLGKYDGVATKPPVNPVKPDSDVCTNCNGVGWVGDTRVFSPCPVCNADGKKPRPASAERIEPVITIYTSDTCTACKKWMIEEAPKYTAKGWAIKEETSATGPWPRFKVCSSVRCFEVNKYMLPKDVVDGLNGNSTGVARNNLPSTN